MADRLRKWLTLLAGVFAGLFIVGVFVAIRLGTFNAVRLETTERGPYRVVCLPHRGSYRRIAEKIRRVREFLEPHGAAGRSCGIYYDRPGAVAEADLRSRGGCLLAGEVEVRPPFEVVEVPRRTVLLARFEGHPVLLPSKVYPQIAGWLAEHGYRRSGPVLEWYGPGWIEVETPVEPVAE